MIAGAEVSPQVLASARETARRHGAKAKLKQKAKAKVGRGESERAGVARKYFVETFGCQMNYHDSERMAGLLEADGYDAADDERDADVVVINTCSVRERAEEKLYTRLGEIREATAGRAARADRRRHRLRRAAGRRRAPARAIRPIDVIVGTQSLKQLPRARRRRRVERRRRRSTSTRTTTSRFRSGVAQHSDPVRAWVTIIEGCNEFCSFCVVPYTRGHERMRPVGRHPRRGARGRARPGRREVQLLGQIVNHYQAPDDAACDFAALLERVSEVAGIARIRFASPHPRHVTTASDRRDSRPAEGLQAPAPAGAVRLEPRPEGDAPPLHARELSRRWSSGSATAVPGIALSTDMIVGFPGETAEDFELTLDLVRRARYPLDVLVQVLAAAEHARDQAHAGRRAGGGEDATDPGAPGAAGATFRPSGIGRRVGTDRRGPGRRRLAAARLGAGGPDDRQHGRQLPGPARRGSGELVPVRITGAGPNSLRGEAVAADAGLEAGHAD